ncbi:hypothetical protein MRX96_040376 [Rhipicephalus microplus]
MTALSATSFALVLILGAFFRESSADEGFFRNRGPAAPALSPSPVNSNFQHWRHYPQHDCHIEVQVTERVRGHCSALTLLGKSFPVCKNGDRISVNNHECAHMAA